MQNSATQRVIALVDMDCFYCQVEARLNPSLKGKPVAVVQYNLWKGGGIIAVNYEARDLGVTRGMRGDEAKEICPEIVLVPVPSIRGKADLTNYRNAGDEVAKIFSEFSDCVQRASIDEAYLDLTKTVQECIQKETGSLHPDDLPNTFVLGYCDSKNKSEDDRKKGLSEWLDLVESQKTNESPDYQLAVGGKIVEKMRSEIFNRTGFHCSAGIAHNKILAKSTAGLHKPKKQTILPQDSIPELYETLPIYKVRNLGGKLGKLVAEKLGIKFMSELYKFSLQELQQKFDEKTSFWLYNIARGIDLEPVTCRLRPESIGCCKNFSGKSMLTTKSEVEHWLKELASEISDRLTKDSERNKRRAKLLTVSFYQESAMSRCTSLNSYEVTKIVHDALELLKKHNNANSNEDVWTPPVKYLGLSASKFIEELSSIEKYLKATKNMNNSEKPKTITPNKISENGKVKKQDVEIKNDTTQPEPGTSKCQQKPSFFLEFLNKKKDQKPEEDKKQPENKNVPEERKESKERKEPEEKEEEEEEEEGSSQNMWISLSEVFPDINEVQPELIEILPDALKKKYKERISSNNEDNVETEIKVVETCEECGKTILKSEVLEHSDYHAALKLYSEINKTNAVNGEVLNKNKPKETESHSKRKKKSVASSPSKKMKSITSFFNVVSKQ